MAEQRLVCEICNSPFMSRTALNLHKKSAKKCGGANGVEPHAIFSCDDCNKQYTRKSSLDRHLNVCKTHKITERKIRVTELESTITKKDVDHIKAIEEKDKIIADLN